MPATTSQRKSMMASADKAASRGEQQMPVALTDSESRADVLNRLRRAEGQLRGIQRMIEEGESCLKVGQQFSAVRKALDSTYLRMTVCFLAQELETHLSPDEGQKADLSAMMKDMETLLARMG
jgi:DNA-binding FrmR family transcriptional regulator